MQRFCYTSFCHTLTQQQMVSASFVSPSSCTVLLLQCFLLNITACTTAQLGGCTFERRAPFATKKGVGLFSGDYGNSAFVNIANRLIKMCVLGKSGTLYTVTTVYITIVYMWDHLTELYVHTHAWKKKHEESMNHISLRPRCYAKSPIA